MATASSSWSCLHSASIIAETNTNVTIRVIAYWKNTNWTYNINYVSAWVYCNGVEQQVKWSSNLDATSDFYGQYLLGYYDYVIAKTKSQQSISCYAKIVSNSSYVSGTKYSAAAVVSVAAKPYHTVTYNVTGGTGAPANQIKWYSESITLSTTKPTKTGHTFLNWCTNTTNTGTKYNPGDEYSSNANLLLYAIWSPNTYTVTYNANGGTGAPSAQTKTYDVDLTLSTTKPTRTNYNFLGWSTSADGGVVYESGAKYTNNNAVTLYAVWEVAYIKPRINNFTATRCTSDGTISESGTYIKIVFDWATDLELTAINVQYKPQTDAAWGGGPLSSSGTTSGSVSQAVGQGKINTDTSYQVRVYVSDSGGTTYSATLSIGTINYPIDIKKGGKGVSIGKAAENDNEFDVNWTGRFRKGLNSYDKSMFYQGTSVMRVNNGSGTAGYILACRITINQTYVNQYILFKVTQRNRCGELKLCFASVNTKDPGILSFKKTGNIAAYIVKNDTSIWDLYIQKSEAYDDIEIVELHKGGYINNVNIQWIDTLSESLPEGCVTASGDMIIDGSINTTDGYKQNNVTFARHSGVNTIISSEDGGNIYLRPNGDSSDAGRVLIKTDGTITAFGGSTRIYGAKVLYNNASGTAGTVTLNDSVANYDYIDIFMVDNGNLQGGYNRISSPNGLEVSLSMVEPSSSTLTFLRRTRYNISGTTITPSTTTAAYVMMQDNAVSHSGASSNWIKIIKVVGYK